MQEQSIYQSWEIRLKHLETNSPSRDPLAGKEQLEILHALLKKYRNSAASRERARFPAYEEASAPPKKRFTLNLRRPMTLLREKLDWRATERVETLLRDIAKIDPQDDLWMQRSRLHAMTPTMADPIARAKPRRGIWAAVLHVNLGLVLRQAAMEAMARTPELLFTDLGKIPCEFPRLAGGYLRSMWNVLSHSDTRDTVDYVIEELEKHNAETRAHPAPAELPKADLSAVPRLFVDRRAILIHHAVSAGTDQRDLASTAQRVFHPVSSGRNTQGEPPSFLDALWNDLRSDDLGQSLDVYGRTIIERHGKSLDNFAARLDYRLLFSDDVVKTFYVNLVYISKALRLLRQHGVGTGRTRGGAGRDWLAGTEADHREQLHDQIAEILNDRELREKALRHFRLELADGSTTVRYTAIAMIGRLGTLDDIGLLLDLVDMLPHGPGNRTECRMLLTAARHLAECVE